MSLHEFRELRKAPVYPAPVAHPSREAWLQAAVAALADDFAMRGATLPKRLRVSAGWPAGRHNYGECFCAEVSRDQTREIFISPIRANSLNILETLIHELCHAALPHKAGHGPAWKKLADSFHILYGSAGMYVGLNETFKRFAAPYLLALGPYPHAELEPWGRMEGDLKGGRCGGGGLRKKQTTRMVKCQCDECGYVARTTRVWINEAGPPLCPCNSKPMEIAP